MQADFHHGLLEAGLPLPARACSRRPPKPVKKSLLMQVRPTRHALKACATAIFHRLSSLSLQHNRKRDGPGVPAVRRALEGVAATGPRSAGRRAELDAVSARASDR